MTEMEQIERRHGIPAAPQCAALHLAVSQRSRETPRLPLIDDDRQLDD